MMEIMGHEYKLFHRGGHVFYCHEYKILGRLFLA